MRGLKTLTLKEAIGKRKDELNIPIDYGTFPYKFTKTWFEKRNQRTWSTFLSRRFDGTTPIHMLQIGVYEGADLVWCFQNILKHPQSRAIAIDPWVGHRQSSQKEMEAVYSRAMHNLRPYRKQLTILRGSSLEILPSFALAPNTLDLIVIDGDHADKAVYQDAVNSMSFLKVGGWMIFDDVRGVVTRRKWVKDGLDKFAAEHGRKFKVAWQHRFADCLERKK